MKKQAGFTLIELVIVIIILGILAVTAAPKFLNLQDDARQSAAQGVKASLQSAAQMIYSKAAIQGIETSSSAVSVAGTTVEAKFGYPTAATVANAVTLDGWSEVSSPKGTFKPADAGSSANCQVVYNEATSLTAPFTVDISGCGK
ncbi:MULTISPECIES: prepilin-type N-terminal cleavage/methylation domain-containing protein [Aeromonas]|uniref:prepilin-type N-terminal cleavage/methylation domain-containing protein n=1 Tax=Aeromonas TaxID=642 RepID=UPI000D0CE705|nr:MULTISPECIES: prepilin-type N-terminal cleavage/methylation domain-containing protein [Aeromonas]AVP86325.1 MSHA biogenesis protein MshA [Aeromonas hydrophila]EIS3738561.1 prepilin-type N-terminal cleavage/methylation domain-containing protein [Aeromonas hydrophila]